MSERERAEPQSPKDRASSSTTTAKPRRPTTPRSVEIVYRHPDPSNEILCRCHPIPGFTPVQSISSRFRIENPTLEMVTQTVAYQSTQKAQLILEENAQNLTKEQLEEVKAKAASTQKLIQSIIKSAIRNVQLPTVSNQGSEYHTDDLGDDEHDYAITGAEAKDKAIAAELSSDFAIQPEDFNQKNYLEHYQDLNDEFPAVFGSYSNPAIFLRLNDQVKFDPFTRTRMSMIAFYMTYRAEFKKG